MKTPNGRVTPRWHAYTRNDILRDKGILPPKPPSPTDILDEALAEAKVRAYENRLEGKDLDELAELEDEEDEAFLEAYRVKRVREIRELQSKARFGSVLPITKADFQQQATEASKALPAVLVLLYAENDASKLLLEVYRRLAEIYAEIKCTFIQGSLCIENYPDRNCPTLLIYKSGELWRNIVGGQTFNRGRPRLAGTF